MVTVTAVIYAATKGQTLHVLKEAEEAMHGECPLDIKVDLMVSL